MASENTDIGLANSAANNTPPSSDVPGGMLQGGETGLFSALFGSAIKGKWFETIMQYSGNYLFTTALILNLFKFTYQVYKFIKEPNKNLEKQASLGWQGLQLAAIATAIVGALFATAAFVLLTPILFVASMALDTLVNIGKLLWNTFQLATLYFKVRKKLTDPLTKLKYEKLRSKYIANIKNYALASVIGAFVTAGAAAIFLFPHISAGGVAAFAATAVAIGSLKTSVAGLFGSAASLAMLSPFIVKGVVALGKRIKSGLSKLFFSKKETTSTTPEDKKPLITEPQNDTTHDVSSTSNILRLSNAGSSTNALIKTEEQLNAAMAHTLNFRAYTLKSKDREIIIDNIDQNNPELALQALHTMINNKINELKEQIDNGRKRNWFAWFENRQEPKRNGKIAGLQDILKYLNGETITNGDELEVTNIPALIKHLENKYPEIKQSQLAESDTDNVLVAVRRFGEKFARTRDDLLAITAPALGKTAMTLTC